MAIHKIKSWRDGKVLWSGEAATLKQAVEKAVKERANLRDADLSRADLSAAYLRAADLSAADLSRADLRAADLSAANLRAADLSAADLSRADLSDANLRAADLRAANLRAADLSRADLRAADLRAADLSAANLRDADLRAADLTPIRDDIWAVLSAAPAEVQGLRDALAAGKIDGSTYTGECACLVGTIANVCHKNINNLSILKPNASRPAERFFLLINKGDTPDESAPAKIALEWVDQWLANMRAAFSTVPADGQFYGT